MSEYEYVWGGCYICGEIEKEEYRTHEVLNNDLIYVCAKEECHIEAEYQGVINNKVD